MNVLNTLFVLTPGAWLGRDHQSVVVRVEQETRLQVPIHTLQSIACFGHQTASHGVLALCLEEGVALSFFSENGRFMGRLDGPARGSLELRRAQFRACDDADKSREAARAIVLGKIVNSRHVLLRRARDAKTLETKQAILDAADHLSRIGPSLARAGTIDQIRGHEGAAAAKYFAVFDACIGAEGFKFAGRNRNPPRDPVNALLSFAYSLLLHDCIAAIYGVGLDPDAGYLHADRPGRPSLALDLMEELRAALCDRFVLALINRGQVRVSDFVTDPAGGVRLSDSGRREFLAAWQTRKREEVEHPLLAISVPWAMLPHLQARLLARWLRGDLDAYPPFVVR